jgi:hypothetical protein
MHRLHAHLEAYMLLFNSMLTSRAPSPLIH